MLLLVKVCVVLAVAARVQARQLSADRMRGLLYRGERTPYVYQQLLNIFTHPEGITGNTARPYLLDPSAGEITFLLSSKFLSEGLRVHLSRGIFFESGRTSFLLHLILSSLLSDIV